MNDETKRTYRSETRTSQAALTRKRILETALRLFQKEGFDRTTINQIAKEASVSAPTVYSLFKSKRGVLHALIDEALPPYKFNELVEEAMGETTGENRMRATAKIARQIYDAERSLLDLMRTAAVVAPELKLLEQEREDRRYHRQKEAVEKMAAKGQLAKGMSIDDARDILWTYTGRDLYRLLVIERGWSPDKYEQWLAGQLQLALIHPQ